ncbi:nibrin-like isoform X2 [Dendronephthya gigantea]|uniref:nibrin-like isoform X2 n=1 Tax=Dendronephthya gigantea TaxID=151771 RepID=UPI001069E13A|nr:nibrin-like isoform X2 [Dendronephthya gigantea]
MWSLKRSEEGFEDEKPYYLTVGEHLVGRKDCQIQVEGDQSVSRKHAWITVSQSGTASAQVSLKDVSKFGCSVNGTKCQKSVAVVLHHNDIITFGTQNCSYRLSFDPLVVYASCLNSAVKNNLKSQLSKLGGYLVNEWQKECSHLVMDSLSFTIKVIYALASCHPIVTQSFFDDLIQAIDSKTDMPCPEKYMPPIKEDLIDTKVVSFHPNVARKSIFVEKLFVFLEKKQYKRLEQAISLAGGQSLLKETGDVSGEDDEILTGEHTLVMSVDWKTNVSEEKQIWIGHVGDMLKSVNRRPIAETEIGLAILHVSLNEYCNSNIDCVPRITKQIVSKSISSMEEMSQRMNESQNILVHEFPGKKPFLMKNENSKPNTIMETPLDSKKRSRDSSDESIPLAFDTPQTSHVENKRRKFSSSDVTHVSQSPESQFKSPGMPLKKKSPNQDQSTKKAPFTTPKKSVDDIEDISESEDGQKPAQPSLCLQETPAVGQKRKAISQSVDITHISQSQESQHERLVPFRSPDEKKFRLTRSKADITHVTQTQASQGEDKLRDRNTVDITHISQSQDEVEECGVGKTMKREYDFNRSGENGNVVLVNKTTPDVVKIQETPSPEINFTSKRRKIASPCLTRPHDNERSIIGETQRSPTSASPPRVGQPTLHDSLFSLKRSQTSLSDEDNIVQSRVKKVTSKEETANEEESTKEPSGKRELNEKKLLSVTKSKRVLHESTSGVQDLSAVNSRISPPGSGWMSKRSFSLKKEKSESHLSESSTNTGHDGVEDLSQTNSRKNAGVDTQRENQGFLSKLQQQTVRTLKKLLSNWRGVFLIPAISCVWNI